MSNVYEFKRPVKANAPTPAPAKNPVPKIDRNELMSQWSMILLASLQAEVAKVCTMPEVYNPEVKHALNFGEDLPIFGRLNIWSDTTKTVEELNGKVPPFVRIEVSPVEEPVSFSGDRTDICRRKLMAHQNLWMDRNPMEHMPPHAVIPVKIWDLFMEAPFELLVVSYYLPQSMGVNDVATIYLRDMEQFLQYKLVYNMHALKTGH